MTRRLGKAEREGLRRAGKAQDRGGCAKCELRREVKEEEQKEKKKGAGWGRGLTCERKPGDEKKVKVKTGDKKEGEGEDIGRGGNDGQPRTWADDAKGNKTKRQRL